MTDSPFIFEASPDNFSTLVLQKSTEVPVIVDFWADWCQPCKMLMPILQKLANEYAGAFVLVKVNTDLHQGLAQQYGVRSLPTVKLFKSGQIADEFMGVQSESFIRDLINKHRTREGEAKRQQALALYRSDDLAGAVVLLEQVVAQEPDFTEAVIELAGILMRLEELDKAEQIIATLPEEIREDEQIKPLIAKLKMSKLKANAGDVAELEHGLAANPDDLEIMLKLANAKVANEDYANGLELFFSIMKKDDRYEDGAGRKGLLATFEILGNTDPLVKTYRSKMFSLLH